MSWQIDPTLLFEMIANPDPAGAGKAMRAMKSMQEARTARSAGDRRLLT